jgi:hypothetical protein
MDHFWAVLPGKRARLGAAGCAGEKGAQVSVTRLNRQKKKKESV